jgi:Helicase HerA, central domain
VREEGLRSGAVKPDDFPERIVVQHLDVAILVDAHRYAEELVCIGDIGSESEGVIFSIHAIADKAHVFRFPLFRLLVVDQRVAAEGLDHLEGLSFTRPQECHEKPEIVAGIVPRYDELGCFFRFDAGLLNKANLTSARINHHSEIMEDSENAMIILGTHSDVGKGILSIPKPDLLHHTAFIGQSGSGKSFAMARLLEEIVLRTRARIVVLDPNGDFGAFYQPQEDGFWGDSRYTAIFRNISSKTPAGTKRYDEKVEFETKWNSVKFQFIASERTNWTPFRDGANAAPLKLHWKWLPKPEQDFLLSVDTTQYPTITQGVNTCFHYIRDHQDEYPQDYSLEDLEGIAQKFALKRVVMADYPEAHSLTDIDWLSVRLQFRSLRHKFHKLWFSGLLHEVESAPSDLTNYLHNSFRYRDSWQVCVVGLAGLDSGHMHLAANVTLSSLWQECVSAWQYARRRASEIRDEELDARETPPDYGVNGPEFDVEADNVADDARTANRTKHQWQDRRVPTFLVIDEAHNFAPDQPTNSLQARTSEKIAAIAAEGRKYGLFVILATQRPQKLRRGLLSECENACLLRIQSKVERTFAADALGEAQDTVHKVGEFDTGEALVIGRWAAGAPIIRFGPARTALGGGGLDKRYWQDL